MSKRYVATIKYWNDDGDPVWGVWDRQEEHYVFVVSAFVVGPAREDARALEEIADAISNA
jgi:hypothetical protein